MESTAINKNRSKWTANYTIQDERVTGTLFYDGEKERDFKNIMIKNGRFNVDIGTGSGVKVTFNAINQNKD